MRLLCCENSSFAESRSRRGPKGIGILPAQTVTILGLGGGPHGNSTEMDLHPRYSEWGLDSNAPSEMNFYAWSNYTEAPQWPHALTPIPTTDEETGATWRVGLGDGRGIARPGRRS